MARGEGKGESVAKLANQIAAIKYTLFSFNIVAWVSFGKGSDPLQLTNQLDHASSPPDQFSGNSPLKEISYYITKVLSESLTREHDFPVLVCDMWKGSYLVWQTSKRPLIRAAIDYPMWVTLSKEHRAVGVRLRVVWANKIKN